MGSSAPLPGFQQDKTYRTPTPAHLLQHLHQPLLGIVQTERDVVAAMLVLDAAAGRRPVGEVIGGTLRVLGTLQPRLRVDTRHAHPPTRVLLHHLLDDFIHSDIRLVIVILFVFRAAPFGIPLHDARHDYHGAFRCEIEFGRLRIDGDKHGVAEMMAGILLTPGRDTAAQFPVHLAPKRNRLPVLVLATQHL